MEGFSAAWGERFTGEDFFVFIATAYGGMRGILWERA
jgi:hypothetical protein